MRPLGGPLGTRTEIKNVNSFRFVGRAIAYEIARQISVLEGGQAVVQATRQWDDDAGVTRLLRSKEEAHDYRYFPDPDLPPITLDAAWVASIRDALPELPHDRMLRYRRDLGLSPYDAEVLTQTAARADYFDAVVTAVGDAKLAANWVMGEVVAWCNQADQPITAAPVSATSLGELLVLLKQQTISSKMAKACFCRHGRLGHDAGRLGGATWGSDHGPGRHRGDGGRGYHRPPVAGRAVPGRQGEAGRIFCGARHGKDSRQSEPTAG